MSTEMFERRRDPDPIHRNSEWQEADVSEQRMEQEAARLLQVYQGSTVENRMNNLWQRALAGESVSEADARQIFQDFANLGERLDISRAVLLNIPVLPTDQRHEEIDPARLRGSPIDRAFREVFEEAQETTRERVDHSRSSLAPEGRVEVPRIDDQVDRILAEIERVLEGFDGPIEVIIQVSPRMAERLHRELGIVGSREDLAGAFERGGVVRSPDYSRKGMRGRNWENDRYARDSFKVQGARDGLRGMPDVQRRFDRTFKRMRDSLSDAPILDEAFSEEGNRKAARGQLLEEHGLPGMQRAFRQIEDTMNKLGPRFERTLSPAEQAEFEAVFGRNAPLPTQESIARLSPGLRRKFERFLREFERVLEEKVAPTVHQEIQRNRGYYQKLLGPEIFE